MRKYWTVTLAWTAALSLAAGLACAIPGCGGGRNSGAQLAPAPGSSPFGANPRQASTSYSVSGYTRKADWAGVSGVTLTFSSGGSATSNSAGYYTKAAVPAGSVTITPSKAGWWFTPASKTVNVNANLSGVNFVGSNSWVVSGKARTHEGNGLYGVTMTFSGGAGTCTTNSLGDYAKTVTAGTYTITPSKTDWVFDPANKTVNVNATTSGVNFIAERCNWAHTWGGSGEEHGNGIALDAAGNTYCAGYSTYYGAGGHEFIVAKFDVNGTLLWRKTWGGTLEDEALDIAVSSTGSVYVAGYSYSFGAGNADAVLLKYNSDGALLWQHVWGGSDLEKGTGVAVDANGYIFVTGYSYSDSGSLNLTGCNLFLLKFGEGGALNWQRCWGGNTNDNGSAVTAKGNNIYVAGETLSFGAGNNDICVLCFATDGSLSWRMTWGGAQNDLGRGIGLDSSNNVYVSGTTFSWGAGQSDFCLLKLNSSGAVQWRRTYGWSGYDTAYDLAVDNYNAIYLCGNAAGAGPGNGDADVLKYTSAGNLVYKRGWGSAGSQSANAIALDAKRFLHICGLAYGTYGSSWFDLIGGTETTSGGTTTSGLGSLDTPTLSVGTPSGTVTTPGGTIDSGGGGADLLALKYAQ